MSSAIRGSATFTNDNYGYPLVGGFERSKLDPEANYAAAKPGHYGRLEMERGGAKLMRMECIPETVTYAFGGGIYDLKVTSGLVWSDCSREWLPM